MTRKRSILIVTITLALVGATLLLLPKLTRAQRGNNTLYSALSEDLGTAFIYQGYLQDGGEPAEGSYNFRFYLWGDSQKTTLLATIPTAGTMPVSASEGLFIVELDFGDQVFNGQERWLEIEVNSIILNPLQRLTAAPYAMTAQNALTATTLIPGAQISGTLSSPGGMLNLSNTAGDGLVVGSAGASGLRVEHTDGDGLLVCATGDRTGCESTDDRHSGVEIVSAEHYGIYIENAGLRGVYVVSTGLDGVFVSSAGDDGLHVGLVGDDGVAVSSAGDDGVYVKSAGDDGVYVASASGDFFKAGSISDPKFRVFNTGDVRADGSFASPAADFAEMMTLEGDPLDYEPGDVLVISTLQVREVALSGEPYSKAVIGVYSTEPAFIGGQPEADSELTGMAPVGMLGIVPTKISAENGAIHPGDLLVTSSTPGHAMRSFDPPPGTVLGKALETLENGTGVILVLVTLQ